MTPVLALAHREGSPFTPFSSLCRYPNWFKMHDKTSPPSWKMNVFQIKILGGTVFIDLDAPNPNMNGNLQKQTEIHENVIVFVFLSSYRTDLLPSNSCWSEPITQKGCLDCFPIENCHFTPPVWSKINFCFCLLGKEINATYARGDSIWYDIWLV